MEVSTDVALESLLACLDPYSEYIPVNRIPFYTAQISGKQRNFGLDLLPIDSQIVITQIEKQVPHLKLASKPVIICCRLIIRMYPH